MANYTAQKSYIKDLAVVSAGGVTGMLVDSAVANAYSASGLPVVKLGTLGIDDILLLAVEGIGGYYLRKKKHIDASNFVIGMGVAVLFTILTVGIIYLLLSKLSLDYVYIDP